MSDKVGDVPLCFYARGWAANEVREEKKDNEMIKITKLKVIFVCVTKIRKQYPMLSLADCARGYWRVGVKSKQCNVLAAVEKGKVKDVWDIDPAFGWKPMGNAMIPFRPFPIDPTRKVCRLIKTVKKNASSLIGKSVRMYGPVDYSF